ncbi:MAG: response regulator transcription factor [Eubacteriales bacterium]
MAIRLVIADDDRLITESMKIILEMDEDFVVVGVAENGADAVKFCQNQKVDVALLDIRMPVMDGVEATRQITTSTETEVLILTTFDEDEYIKKAFEYGAGGYLLKNNPPEQIKTAIKAVAGGNAVVQAAVMEKIKNPDKRQAQKLKGLTERETQVVEAIAEGMTNKEIAKKLFISEGTVKNNITAILGKLDLSHRTQIAIYYLKQ